MTVFKNCSGHRIELSFNSDEKNTRPITAITGTGVSVLKVERQNIFLRAIKEIAGFTDDDCQIVRAYLPFDAPEYHIADVFDALKTAGMDDLAEKLEPYSERMTMAAEA